MKIFIFLHVLTMFIAVAMAYGPAMLMVVASRNGDVAALRGISRAGERLAKLVSPAFILGIALGVIAIFTNGFDPLAGWLLIAYALVVVAVITTITFTDPWLKRVNAAVVASPDDSPSAELQALLTSPRNRALLIFDALVIVALIADMVLKPLPGRIF